MKISFTFTALLLTFLILATHAGPLRGDMLYVSDFNNDAVYQLDAATGNLLNTFTAPSFLESPSGLALSPDGGTLYVAATNASNFDVYLFDTATGLRTNQFNGTTTGGRGLALSPDGNTLYMSSVSQGTITAFNTTTGSSTIPLFGFNDPEGILVAPDGNSLFVANTGANDARRVSLPGGNQLQEYNAPASLYSPSDVVLSPDGSKLYVSTFGDSSTTNNQILEYNASTGSLSDIFNVPAPDGDLYGMTINPDGSVLYVADIFNGRLLTVNTTTGFSSVFSTNAPLNAPAFVLYAVSPAAVPEPSSFLLLGLVGGTGLIGARWRKRRTQTA